MRKLIEECDAVTMKVVEQMTRKIQALSDDQFETMSEQVNQMDDETLKTLVAEEADHRAKKKREKQ